MNTPRPAAQAQLRPRAAWLLLVAALLGLTRGRDLAGRLLANAASIRVMQAALTGRPQTERATALLDAAVSLQAQHATLGLGRAAYLRGDWDAAAAILEPYVQDHPADEVAGYFFAASVVAQGRPPDIARLRLVPPQTLAAIVLSKIQAEDWETAEAIWLGVPHGPGNVELAHLMAINSALAQHALEMQACDRGQWLLNEALAWRAEMPELRPEEYYTLSIYDLGRCYLAQDDRPQAAKYLRETLARDPRFNHWTYVFLSEIAAANGDPAAARQWLLTGLAVFPGDEIFVERLNLLPG